ETTSDQLPLPAQSSTVIAWRRMPGATPTTPAVSSRAPIVPATCVPCPLQSRGGPLAYCLNSTTLRSGCEVSIPVSMTYASTFVIASEPLPARVELASASILSTPQGSVCAVAVAIPSTSTYAT